MRTIPASLSAIFTILIATEAISEIVVKKPTNRTIEVLAEARLTGLRTLPQHFLLTTSDGRPLGMNTNIVYSASQNVDSLKEFAKIKSLDLRKVSLLDKSMLAIELIKSRENLYLNDARNNQIHIKKVYGGAWTETRWGT